MMSATNRKREAEKKRRVKHNRRVRQYTLVMYEPFIDKLDCEERAHTRIDVLVGSQEP